MPGFTWPGTKFLLEILLIVSMVFVLFEIFREVIFVPNKTTITVTIDRELHDELVNLRDSQGTPWSFVVNTALKTYLQKFRFSGSPPEKN